MKKRAKYTLASTGVITTIIVYFIISSHVAILFAPEAEREMARSMGITVKELRNQTPEEHMEMMQKMMHEKPEEGMVPGIDINIQNLPEVKPTETLEVKDGDTITLNPTLVQKTINGKEFAMYGYNGQIPGPIIKTKQSATITVDVQNNIDMETTVHWHGLRLDNAFDGVPGVTQEPIAPKDTFRYSVSLPDEGVYWYHPHVREDIQQDTGLYGNLLVEPEDSNAYSPANSTEVMVLDDLLLDEEGNLVPYATEGTNFPLMGRFGNVMLVNGSPADEYNLTVDRGEVTRFYITNVANTRTFRIRIDGGAMKRVGSDVGRYEREEWVDTVTIAPAERYIVDVLFEDDGRYKITHESPLESYDLGFVEVTNTDVDTSYDDEFNTLHTFDDVVADIDTFREYFDKEVDKTLLLDIEMSGMMDHEMMMEHTDDGIEWEDTMPAMNEQMGNDDVQWKFIDTDTEKVNMDIHWKFKVGDIVKVRVINDEDSAHPMQHPVHFHGQRFLVLSMDGEENKNLAWKDTVLIPTGSTADLLFDMSNPGDWMFHCHIAEHLTNGMMGMFTVEK